MVLLILVSLPFAAMALKKPDFSGTWKINESESTLNAEFSFAPKQVVITQEKNLMTYETTSDFQGQEFTRTSKYTLDGKESKNEGFQGSELISVASWEDESLKVVTNLEMQDGNTLNITVTYSLKGDKLVIVNEVTGGPMGDSKETWVYDKQ
jgi:hypothetical protein